MITNQTLKNAARALGYDLWSDPDGSHYLVDYDGVKLKRWDPEHDDGDSFRLMTSLRMIVEVDHYHAIANGSIQPVAMLGGCHAATRVAIVRAAAEIGAAL